MPFVVTANGSPKVTSDPDANWENDAIQFARLIAELDAADFFGHTARRQVREVCASMDITDEQFAELVERAEDVWSTVKDDLPQKKQE